MVALTTAPEPKAAPAGQQIRVDTVDRDELFREVGLYRPGVRLSRKDVRDFSESRGYDFVDVLSAVKELKRFTAVGRPEKPKLTIPERVNSLRGVVPVQQAATTLGMDHVVVWDHWTGRSLLGKSPRTLKDVDEALAERVRSEPSGVSARKIAAKYHLGVAAVRSIRSKAGKCEWSIPGWAVREIYRSKDLDPRPSLADVADRFGVDESYVSKVWSGRLRVSAVNEASS